MKRAREEDAGHTEAPPIVILVGGADAFTAEIREGLGATGLPVRSTADCDEALQLAGDPDVRLIVVDAQVSPQAASRLPGTLDPSRVLFLLPEDGSPVGRTDGGTVPHYLSRPFTAETLTALVSHLAGRPGSAGERNRRRRVMQARPPRPFQPYRLYEKARETATAILDQARARERLDLDVLRPLAEEIHTDLLQRNLLVTRSLEPHEAYDLASHCVNVAIIGGKLSMGLAASVEDVLRVIQAGLIHDVGMTRLPESLLRKPTALDEQELAELRRHPVYGSELVETLGARFAWLATAVLQEHERASGQGYPAGLVVSRIDPVARVLGVADVFEALSHPRVYRSPFTGLEALQMVVGMQEEYFEPRIVQALVNEISAFPLDSYVQLSTGEIGRVVATHASNILRPSVEVYWDAEWRAVETPYEIDLARRPEVSVSRALLEAELPIT